MGIDPAIIQDLAEKLRVGDEVLPEDVQKSKWEYAMVFIAKLELCKGLATVKEQQAYLISEFPRYMQVCSIVFPELATWVEQLVDFPKCKPGEFMASLSEIIVDHMMNSLARDMTNFGEPTPERFFKPYDLWKLDETYRLLDDMGLKPVDPYKAVSGMHKYYEVCKHLTGGDHDMAMNRLEQRYDGYQQTMTLMTLMQHIHSLEKRLERLEAKP